MLREEPIHQTITEEVKQKIKDLKIIFPSRYSMFFSEIAREHQVDLGPETFLSNESLDDEVIDHAKQLSDSAKKAVDAMESKNDQALREVIEETKRLREEIGSLRSAVYEDALTGAYNRKWMMDNLATGEGRYFNRDGVFVLVDMNDFKRINDDFGHVSGDKVLTLVAAQLKRSGGHVVRYGGDEFCVFFEADVTEKSVGQKMHIIRETLIKKPLKVGNRQFRASFSLGISSFGSGDEITKVIDIADQKMYDDKVRIKARLSEMNGF